MTQYGQREPGPYEITSLHPGTHDLTSLYTGRPPRQAPQNLAVQQSLMEIFDDFTEIVSGELKSMNLDEFEQARREDADSSA